MPTDETSRAPDDFGAFMIIRGRMLVTQSSSVRSLTPGPNTPQSSREKSNPCLVMCSTKLMPGSKSRRGTADPRTGNTQDWRVASPGSSWFRRIAPRFYMRRRFPDISSRHCASGVDATRCPWPVPAEPTVVR